MDLETESPSRLRRLSFDRPDWPFDPRRVPFFYGWVVVVVATLGVLCSAPGQTIGVAVFTDDLMAVTGLSRVQISLTYLVGTMGGALFLPGAGRIYDRLGARTMTVVTATAFGSTLLLLSQLDRAIAALRFLLSAEFFAIPVAFTVMAGSFFALRFLGQGVLTICSRNMMVKWFDARRGLANGVMGIMSSFGFSAAPVFFDVLIEEWGWKGAWQILGVSIIIGLTAQAVVFYRDNPEECGMKPDGRQISNPSRRRATGSDHTAAQVRATLAFWLIMLGLGRDSAISVFLPAAGIAVASNFIGGWLSDRTTLRWHLALFLVGIIVTNIGVLHLHLSWGRYGIIVGSGLMGGMMRLLSTLAWPRYFGRRHLGAVSGFSMALGVSASAVGPSLFGLSLESLGSYHPACWTTIVLSMVFLILSPWAREPD